MNMAARPPALSKGKKIGLIVFLVVMLIIVIVLVIVGKSSSSSSTSGSGSEAGSDSVLTDEQVTTNDGDDETVPTSSQPEQQPEEQVFSEGNNPFTSRYILSPKKILYFVDSDASVRKVNIDLTKAKMPSTCPDANDYTTTDFTDKNTLAMYTDPALLELLSKGTIATTTTSLYIPPLKMGEPIESTGVCKPVPADRPPAFVSAAEDNDFSFLNSTNYKTSPSSKNTTVNTAQLSENESISYLTAYPEVETLLTSDRSVNISIARKHFQDNGAIPAKRVDFFSKPSGKTTYVFIATSPKPISELTVTLNGAKSTSLADIREAIRNRLTTIYTWIQTAITITEATYNKKTMTTAEFDACNALLKKCMILMFGISGDPVDKNGKFQMDKVMKLTRPQLPEPVEINGVVANYIYLNGQWYAVTVSRLAAWALLDTRTSRMIYHCTNAAGVQPGCTAGASDNVCDFVQTGFPQDINKSPCDPDTIYGRYALLVQYNVRMRQERARQLDPYKRQKSYKGAHRCYHNSVSGSQSKMPSPSGDKDTWGYWYKYDAGPKGFGCNGCRSGYESYDKSCQCRVKYKKGKCDTKSSIRTVAMNFLQGSKEPVVYSAPQTDVDDS
jgi:hypothetical protein